MKNSGLAKTKKLSLELPEEVVTKSGVLFDPRTNVWRYLDGTESISFNFQRANCLSPELLWAFKKTLIWYVEHKAPATAIATFNKLVYLFRHVSEKKSSVTSLTYVELVNVRSKWREKKRHDEDFSKVKTALLRWYRFGYPGVTEDAAKYLQDVKLKRAESGAKVSTLDPNDGPFTDIEREALLDQLSLGYSEGAMTMQQYIIAWLAALFGQRPKQYALMKLCDLIKIEDEGLIRYKLQLPLAKGISEAPRMDFQEVELIPELAALFSAYKARLVEQFRGVFDDPEQAQFFSSQSPRKSENIEDFNYHMQGLHITDELQRAFAKLDVKSERTGKTISVTAYRFRYTLGTNCIRQGLGVEATAKRLGHRTTASMKSYIAMARAYETIDRIDLAVASRLGTLAQAFKGKLIINNLEKDKDASTHILSPAIDQGLEFPMGSCGKDGFCAFNKPIACYTCILFRAWLDGPHEAVYAYLGAQRDKLLASGCDSTISKINDRTMMAVANVIALCNE